MRYLIKYAIITLLAQGRDEVTSLQLKHAVTIVLHSLRKLGYLSVLSSSFFLRPSK
jgi:hypothetical protein